MSGESAPEVTGPAIAPCGVSFGHLETRTSGQVEPALSGEESIAKFNCRRLPRGSGTTA